MSFAVVAVRVIVAAVMTAHDVVTAYWAGAEARDGQAFGGLLAGDVLYCDPQARD